MESLRELTSSLSTTSYRRVDCLLGIFLAVTAVLIEGIQIAALVVILVQNLSPTGLPVACPALSAAAAFAMIIVGFCISHMIHNNKKFGNCCVVLLTAIIISAGITIGIKHTFILFDKLFISCHKLC